MVENPRAAAWQLPREAAGEATTPLLNCREPIPHLPTRVGKELCI